MILRPAHPRDIERIASIHRTARAAAMPWLAVVHSEAEDRWFFEHRVLAKQTVQVAEICGAVVGFAAISDGWLHHLYVAPNAWRQGVGAQLLAQAQDASCALELWTFQRNADARRFYAARGFVEGALTDGTENDEREPDVRMVWTR